MVRLEFKRFISSVEFLWDAYHNSEFCSHIITWERREQFVRFQFLAHVNQLNIGENFYQSIALSEDKFMVSKRENVLLEIADDKYMFLLLGSNFCDCLGGRG